MATPDYNYLDLLNEQQRAAVEYNDGPSLVIAGAGSGKTRVLTYKIVHLIRNGYEPYRILALTFTNKAAREMRERITGLVGENVASRLWMGTFHSIFLRLLRKHTEEIGFKPGFTIYDSADSKSLVKMIIKEMGLDEKAYKPAVVSSVISNAKNAMVSPAQYMEDRDFRNADKRAGRPMTAEIYSRYCERCRIANVMDFDDILLHTNRLLRDYPEIRRHYQEFFRFILVDEYQDTNFAQHLIVSQLAGDKMKLCVVGDDAQSIYSFRGADINNILNLGQRYPGLRIFKLERNYRSTQNIIEAAGSLIKKNTMQMEKNVFSENERGERVNVLRTHSDLEEAFTIANLVSETQLTSHDTLDGYAVLYRTNAQSRVIEEALRKRNIPYRIYGGLSFYQRKEVKDMVSYFRLSVNPDDDEALRRIINYPARGIGETTLKKLQALATAEGKSLWQAIGNGNLKEASINAGTVSKLMGFKRLIDEFISDDEAGSDAFELGQLIYNRTGILTSLAHDNTPESISKQENLSEILAGLKYFVESRHQSGEGTPDMRSFLSEISLATDQDSDDGDAKPKVTLMTAHAAKGLEFDHVFIVGVEEDLFPSSMSYDSMEKVEEERRLLYVAMTRARKTCTLTYAESRFRNGQTVKSKPSRFIGELDPGNIKCNFRRSTTAQPPFAGYAAGHDASGEPRRETVQPEQRQLAKVSSIVGAGSGIKPQHTVEEVAEGSLIRHGKFGTGRVLKISQLSGEDMVTVDFGDEGQKKLLLKFAKFDIIRK